MLVELLSIGKYFAILISPSFYKCAATLFSGKYLLKVYTVVNIKEMLLVLNQ